MSHRLFEATLSVPSPTLTPASIIPSSGAIPCPSFAFDFGQWATRAPYRVISLTSGWVTWTQGTSGGLVSKTPMDSRYLIVDIPGARHSIPRPARPRANSPVPVVNMSCSAADSAAWVHTSSDGAEAYPATL